MFPLSHSSKHQAPNTIRAIAYRLIPFGAPPTSLTLETWFDTYDPYYGDVAHLDND